MVELIRFNLPTLIVALLIGVATGWWMFRHRRRGGSETRKDSKEI